MMLLARYKTGNVSIGNPEGKKLLHTNKNR